MAETSLDDAKPVATKDDDDDVTLTVESLELRMYRLIVANNMEIVFPYTWIALRIYLSLMISIPINFPIEADICSHEVAHAQFSNVYPREVGN